MVHPNNNYLGANKGGKRLYSENYMSVLKEIGSWK